jgi:hypothetical protein
MPIMVNDAGGLLGGYTPPDSTTKQTTSTSQTSDTNTDGGGPPTKRVDTHPVQPTPTHTPPAQVARTYRPAAYPASERAHPTAALTHVMHQGGGITVPVIGPSASPRLKTQAHPTAELTRHIRSNGKAAQPTGRANPSGRHPGATRSSGGRSDGDTRRLESAKQSGKRSDAPPEPGGWDFWQTMRDVLEGTAPDPYGKWEETFIRKHWSGPTFSKPQLKLAESLITAHEVGGNPNLVDLGFSARRLMEHVWALEGEMITASPSRRRELTGELSATGFVLYAIGAGGYVPRLGDSWGPDPSRHP